MRIVIQRVKQASVVVEDKVISSIEKGFLILLGIENNDTQDDIDWLTGKIAKLRVFGDENGAMNLSISDVGGEIIVVSQFTLFASTKKGNRPSFIKSAKPQTAVPLYESFIQSLEISMENKVQTGKFGAMMDVSLINDGPVTILIDSKNRE